MILSDKGKLHDPNYAHLHMLSFAYNPSNIGHEIPFTYGLVAEYITDPFLSERKFLTCYDSGFAACYSTHNGGSINGNTNLEYSRIAQLTSFEQFISAQTENAQSETMSEGSLYKRSKQLVATAANYIKHTKEVIDIKEHQEVQFWLLTSSGIFSGGAHFFEVRNKTSVWTDLFNEVQSIVKDCQSAGPDKGSISVAASF